MGRRAHELARPAPSPAHSAAAPARIAGDPAILLEAVGLSKAYPQPRSLLRPPPPPLRAVDGVSFYIREGETLGLVGESGCGKSTLARMLVRLIEPSSGRVLFRASSLGSRVHGPSLRRGRVRAPVRGEGVRGETAVVDLTALDRRTLRSVRREIQLIFQEPVASLTPHMRVEQILKEPFAFHHTGLSRSEVEARVEALARRVGLRPSDLSRYPAQLSGGQCQRVGIARALALKPRLIVADEPLASLDVSVQGQVLNLLCDLQESEGLAYLFIAHDLSVVRHISDRVAVMYLGRIVETAPVAHLFRAPKHPYTEALLSAVPVPDPNAPRRRIRLKGAPPSPLQPPPGCPFHPRCPYATPGRRLRKCASERPEPRRVGPEHWAACHFSDELKLRGML